jgi:hypothetical protein
VNPLSRVKHILRTIAQEIRQGVAFYVQAIRHRFRPAAPPPGPTPTDTGRDPRARLWVPVRTALVRVPDPRRLLGTVVNRITPGHEMGSGGQGRVFAVQGRSDIVLKQFTTPIPEAVGDLETLIEARAGVEARLADTRIDLCWPIQATAEDDKLTGYIMPRIASDFFYSTDWRGRDRERQLAFAIREISAVKLPFLVNDEQRVELVWLVARFLDAMHSEGLAYGDISWTNFSFQIDPVVRLSVHDFDSTRIMGRRSLTRAPAAHTVDWDDPRAQPEAAASFDTDRYRFALLAYRMLVGKTLDGRIDSDQIPDQIPMFNDHQVKHMRSLWIRADGDRGTRPTIHEWLSALESQPATL